MRIIGVFSAKGGVGKTVTACNLGVASVGCNKRVALVDCNMTTSHAGLYLGMTFGSPVTLNHVLRHEAQLSHALYRHHSGLDVIPSSMDLSDLINVDTAAFKSALRGLDGYDAVFLDAAPGLGKEALITLESCSELLFIATPHIPAVLDISKSLNLMRSLELEAVPIGIVLNRVRHKPYELGVREVERLTGMQVLAQIPEDERMLWSTNARGPVVHLYPDSPSSRALCALAARLFGYQYRPVPHMLERLLRFFRRG